MKIKQAIIESLQFLYDIITPRDKCQKRIFIVFLGIYVVFSVLMCHLTDFTFPGEILNYDLDGWSHGLAAKKTLFFLCGNYRHPLIIIFLYPLVLLSCIIQAFSGELAYHMILLYLFYNIIAALSITIVYKYFRNLLGLTKYRSLLICIFFGLFAHVLLLSFIPESYPLSMFGLLILVYMTTDNILTGKKIPLVANIIMFCYITGVTVTNGLKVLFAQLFQEGKFIKKCKTVVISGSVCAGLIVLFYVITYILCSLFLGDDYTNRLLFFNQINDFVSRKPLDIKVVSDFLFEPILFHHNHGFWSWEIVFRYNTILPVIVGSIMYLLLFIALLINMKENSILLLLLFFLSDVLIHIVYGYGADSLYIFGFHWLFICPLMIGWLYKKIKNIRIKVGLDILVICLATSFAINNIPILFNLFFPNNGG